MKKSILRAALSPLFTGQHRRNISTAISGKPRLTLFNGHGRVNRALASLNLEGINSQKRSLCSFVEDEDDFSELGAPLTQVAGKQLKLVTQKPEPYRKIDPAKKYFSGRSLPGESSSGAKGIIRESFRASQAVPKFKNHNVGSRQAMDTKNISRVTRSTSVTIEDIPATVGLSQMIEAISVFGEVSSASMRTCDGIDCCDVRFESAESSRRAVSVGGITVKSFHLSIRPLDVPDTVAIRIKRISNGTADAAIHSVCSSFGSLKGLARTKEDEVDVLYNVKDDLESESILKRLNNTTTDGRQWSAHLLVRDSTNNEEAKCKLGLQISSHLAELKRQVYMKKIAAEDLQTLHWSLLHLEETPPSC